MLGFIDYLLLVSIVERKSIWNQLDDLLSYRTGLEFHMGIHLNE